MKYPIKGLLSTILAAGLMVTTPAISTAFAGGAEGDYQRAKKCGEMRRAGTVEWYSIASGTVNTGGGRNGYSGFITKACHTTEASCQRWVRRVGYEIANLDTIEVAYCKRVR